jgi:hypothetical protein
MANHLDHIKMMALGRNFAIGTLYNYVEDVVVPSKSNNNLLHLNIQFQLDFTF